jgi:hypothetical protein
MTDKLAHITAAKCVEDWEGRVIPPTVASNDFGRALVRSSYAGGFGAAVTLAIKLQEAPPAERLAILKRLEREAQEFLMASQDAQGMPRA